MFKRKHGRKRTGKKIEFKQVQVKSRKETNTESRLNKKIK